MEQEKLKVIKGGINPVYDNDLIIATGANRYEKNWKNRTMRWSKLLEKLAVSKETGETHAEYMAMAKADQDRVKDVGGFVGGHLKEGKRRNGYVEARQIVTLDIDFPPADVPGEIDLLGIDFAYCLYSTHKHSERTPRYRLIIPTDRNMDADEYEAVARQIASLIDIDIFDDTTYQAARLMYWPSHSTDVTPVYVMKDAPWLSVDDMLSRYPDWKDVSYWPMSSRVASIHKRQTDRAGDPLTKPGLIGAFNRAYRVPEAIETFLSDVYAATTKEDRYTYTSGSTAMGLVIYNDGLFAYSNHSTDPTGGQLCNAFDLVRIHKFGQQDVDAKPDTPVNRLPSFKAMQELARNDSAVKAGLLEEAAGDFDALTDDGDWKDKLSFNKKGDLENTLQNLELILTNDEKLQGLVFNELADDMEIKGDVPWRHPAKFWRDADDAQLISYVDGRYGTFSARNYDVAVTKIVDDRSYHPIRDYFDRLPKWDGVKRVDTLLIDYLGAEDNDYSRAVTRKLLCAAYVRVYRPGAKFDYMIVLNGDQGIGKSTLIAKLGGEWYSDSLAVSDMNDKTAAEKLQGYWIVEIGELAGMRKADIDKVKAFISRQDDKYRASFGRRVTSHPRQCVFIGTTNSKDGYLRDVTGNRRYWNVRVTGGTKKPWDLTDADVGMIWAEVKVLAEEGEKLYLPPELKEYTTREQRKAMEHDAREGLVLKYLDTLLPENWDDMPLDERLQFLDDADSEDGFYQPGTVRREYVSNMEIWCECFRKQKSDFEPRKAYPISMIMASLGDWERSEIQKRIPIYGKQRVFKRKSEFEF